jgi:hypothetical protein
MVKGKRGLAVTVLVVAAASLAAQARPDFSGTWVEDRERLTNLLTGKPVVTGQASGGGAMAMQVGDTAVTQTVETVTVDTKIPKFDSSIRQVYKLDGSKSVNHNGAQTRTTTSRWDGDRLVTEGTIFQVTSQGETTWGIKEVMYLERGELVIESHWTQDGTVTTANRRVYRRAGRS